MGKRKVMSYRVVFLNARDEWLTMTPSYPTPEEAMAVAERILRADQARIDPAYESGYPVRYDIESSEQASRPRPA